MSDANAMRDIYLTGAKNLHAVETQAVEMLSRQVERLQNYPELEARLRQHIDESKQQGQRLEQILHANGTDYSTVKETVTGLVGNVAAVVHAPMQDEVMKNHFANYAYENYEIAAYTSLIAMAETVGDTAALPLLQTSLKEAQDMAAFLERMTAPTTQKYMQRAAAGEKADR